MDALRCRLVRATCLFSMMTLTGAIITPQEQGGVQKIHVQAAEVVVDANVTTSSGKPARGLTQTDFEVFEDGIKQQIASFRYVAGENAATGQIPRGDKPSEWLPYSASYPRLVSIVFDKTNMGPGDALRAANAARTYVTKLHRGSAMAAVFGVGSTVHIFQRFTTDPDRLLQAINAATSSSAPRPGDVSQEINDALRAGDFTELRILMKFRDIDEEIRGDISLKGLLAIIEGQRVVPGRKSIILFSSGFTAITNGARITGTGTEIRAVTSAANRAGVTIYALNTAGLTDFDQDPDQRRQGALREASRSKASVGPLTALGIMSRSVGLNTALNLQQLAEDTGGYSVRNMNDLIPGMESIASYSDEYYVLTYVPSNPILDGRFRTISVKLKRSGLTAMARRGYYAFPDTDRLPVTGFEAELLEAVAAKKPPESFPVRVAGLCFPSSDAVPTAALFVQCPFSEFNFEKIRETRNISAKVDVMLLVRKADGSIVHRLSRQYDVEGPQEQAASIKQKSFSFCRRVPLEPARYVLEAAVRDRINGKIAVKKIDFTIDSLPQQQLQLSSILLNHNPTQIFDADLAKAANGLEDPLRLQGRNLAPDLAAVFSKSSDKELIVYFIARTARALLPVQCTVEFFRDGTPALQEQRSLYDTAARPIPCLLEIGLDRLQPGKYDVRVTAKDKSVSITHNATFVIVP